MKYNCSKCGSNEEICDCFKEINRNELKTLNELNPLKIPCINDYNKILKAEAIKWFNEFSSPNKEYISNYQIGKADFIKMFFNLTEGDLAE